MVPLCVQYLQNTALWDHSSSYLNACKVITRSLSPRIPRCLSSIIFCATSRVAAVVYQPQPKHPANALLARATSPGCPQLKRLTGEKGTDWQSIFIQELLARSIP
jgi:hypothetical protein